MVLLLVVVVLAVVLRLLFLAQLLSSRKQTSSHGVSQACRTALCVRAASSGCQQERRQGQEEVRTLCVEVGKKKKWGELMLSMHA